MVVYVCVTVCVRCGVVGSVGSVRCGIVGSVQYGVVLLFSTGAWYNCSLLSLSRTLQGQVQVVSLVKSGTFTSVVRV